MKVIIDIRMTTEAMITIMPGFPKTPSMMLSAVSLKEREGAGGP
jgi:hypothetical protein